MALRPSEVNYRELEDWIDGLGLRHIRKSDSVQRLKRIRFLGTMPYIVKVKYHYSRYDHSLSVARLADEMGKRAGLSPETRKSLVLTALLHDIGHLPFSHASEVFFRQTWTKYHSSHSSRLAGHIVKTLRLSGEPGLAQEVTSAARSLGERRGARNWESFEDYATHEIFHGALSADTLDGICRASESVAVLPPDPATIISGIERRGDQLYLSEDVQPLVEDFLLLKHRIYSEYVYSTRGVIAEAMLTRALQIAFRNISQRKEFLSLDDSDATERMRANRLAADLMQRLESGDLFCSLRDAAPDRHRLITSLFTRLCSAEGDPLEVQKALEAVIAAQARISTVQYLIIHPSIRLDFGGRFFAQRRLFVVPLTLDEVGAQAGFTKSYGNSIEIVFPQDALENLKFIAVPKPFSIPKKPTKRGTADASLSALEQHRGAYMTPPGVARFLVNWAIQDSMSNVLDPASGEGIFLREALRRLVDLGASPSEATTRILGVESDRQSWLESTQSLLADAGSPCASIVNGDFFDFVSRYASGQGGPPFKAIVGNPPYIRSHRFQGEKRRLSTEALAKFDARLSALSSSWAAYVVCVSELLSADGRLAMVLPTELLWTDYARDVRQMLKERFRSLTLVRFDKLIFGNTQQDVLLLLASNDDPPGMRHIELEDDAELREGILRRSIPVEDDSMCLGDKWTGILADGASMRLVESLYQDSRVNRLGDIADISLGRVTGNNNFFVLSRGTVERFGVAEKWLSPAVPRASWLSGLAFDDAEWRSHEQKGDKCYILQIPTTADVISDKALPDYLDYGRRNGVDQKYKCRTRWPWYSVPMQKTPDAFLTYMSGDLVRLVLNIAGASCTNTIHNVVFKPQIDSDERKACVVSFYSSLTAFSAEVSGRAYGGGVLKLELKEARSILVPNILRMSRKKISQLAGMFWDLDRVMRLDYSEAMAEVDRLILREELGLTKSEVKALATESARLRRRRVL